MRCAGGIQLNKLHLARDHATITGAVGASILNGVLQVHQRPRLLARIVRVYQHRPPFEEIPVAFQHEVYGGVEEWMTGADEGGKSCGGEPMTGFGGGGYSARLSARYRGAKKYMEYAGKKTMAGTEMSAIT